MLAAKSLRFVNHKELITVSGVLATLDRYNSAFRSAVVVTGREQVSPRQT